MPESLGRTGDNGFVVTVKRFGFPALLLLAAIVVHLGWIGSFTFLGTFVQWTKIQAFLAKNNEGFFLTALLAFYLEVVRPNTFSAFFRARLESLDGFLAATTVADGLRFFLNRHHGEHTRNLHVEQLAEYIASEKPTLTNSVIEISLHRAPRRGGAGALRRFRMHYDAELSTAVLACTRTPAMQARLFALFPEILEAVVLDQDADFASACNDLLAESPILVNNDRLDFLPMRLDGDARLDKLQGSVRGADWELYAARVERSGRRETNSFTVELKVTMAVAEAGIAHWIADRPMHVRRIVINVNEMRDIDGVVFKLIPFLGAYDGIRGDDFASGECTVLINRWLVHGQGVCLAWHRGPQAPAAGATPASVSAG